MDRLSFLRLLESDGRVLRAAAERDPAAAVPTCPGWTVRDVVEHTAEVYEHKIACIRLGGPRPDPWPPNWPADRDPLAWFADAHGRLLDLLHDTDPATPSWTWWPPDQSAGFWVRRMAQETAVHRTDVQSAYDAMTPVDPALAVDGVDEVLHLMLAGDWSEDPQPDSVGTIVVATGGRTWRMALESDHVGVTDEDAVAAARVDGDPSELLLWLWGRRPQSVVRTGGDEVMIRRLRERLALATQ
ncbi:MAG: maleylpyruvate isomerase family mycothiol-dependent enzyme [Actinomycetota bacterium]|nr:maleylpyruvate isomerase family mycothiol-dependent enzyme [Actinomycetota bacterium]MDP9461598.1 maleylpyruvate isomerase family mycothiol-dependent enzyme [Actinomycetota bacterium]